jgi:hypothetical protein
MTIMLAWSILVTFGNEFFSRGATVAQREKKKRSWFRSGKLKK